MAISADEVKRKIIEAFGATPRPGDEDLVTDQSGCDPESREIVSAFKGKDWRGVSVEMLREHRDALPLFTPAAFRYYLPAYMIGCVDLSYDLDVVFDNTLFNLTPPKERGGWEWDFFWARARQFNERERDAIKAFLELIDQYERTDWATLGREPMEDRVGPAFDFWTELDARR